MKYFIANWKMNMSLSTINEWKQAWNELSRDFNNSTNKFIDKEIILAPSLPHLLHMNELNVNLAAQDVSEHEKGAHTGETGAFQLRDLVKYCIVGHSERKENRDTVLKKATQCLENQIIPVVCFTQPEDAHTFYTDGVILAWEDPANISQNGAYRAKPIEQIKIDVENMRQNIPSDVKIVYGGSVNIDNISDLKSTKLLDGVLVGNASLDAKHFYGLVTAEEK